MPGKKFKIIKIIDESTFMIDAGKMDIDKGDILRIIGDKTIPIKEPDTDKVIEELPTYKAYLTAEFVYDRVSICKTEWVKGYSTDGLIKKSSFADISKQFKMMTEGTRVPGHYEEVPINEEQIEDFDNNDDSPVSLGNKVELVSSED